MDRYTFDSDFVWGTATASYQIEGAVAEGNRGETIWDRFTHIPGNVEDGTNADVTCDHYHLFREDVALMHTLGIKAYRFSIAWARIIPDGEGVVNQAGLQFYSDLIDELLKYGIEPYVTLYHWDLPQNLQNKGGWANRYTADCFARYAEVVFHAFKGRVTKWITLNEPYIVATYGNFTGVHAPGLRDFSTALQVSYNLYVAHGKAVKLFREMGIPGEIGIAQSINPLVPATDSPEDVAAAMRYDGYAIRWFMDPIYKGTYPQDMLDWYQSKGIVLPQITGEDLELMSQKLDFLGINYYFADMIHADPQAWPIEAKIQNPMDEPKTAVGWRITPDDFRDLLIRMSREYDVGKILITENGTAIQDFVNMEGRIVDDGRIDYIKRHLRAISQANEMGANCKGYFVWSFMDNFEWALGYIPRFGIVYMDYATNKRIPKQSAYWYKDVIEHSGFTI